MKPVKLNSNQVNNLEGQKFLQRTTLAEDSKNFERGGVLPSSSQTQTSFVHIAQETQKVKSGKGTEQNKLFLGLEKCASNNPGPAKASINEARKEYSNWETLPPGVKVSAITYLDANKDGQTDVLVKLSNGTGFLLNSESPDWGR